MIRFQVTSGLPPDAVSTVVVGGPRGHGRTLYPSDRIAAALVALTESKLPSIGRHRGGCGRDPAGIAVILRVMSVSDVFRRRPRNRWLNMPLIIAVCMLMSLGPRLWISSYPWQQVWIVAIGVLGVVAMYVADWAWERHKATRQQPR